MRSNVRIEVTYKEKTKFVSTFVIDREVDEYIIADRAWDTALSYAELVGRNKWGKSCNMSKIGEILKDIDYTYSIEQVGD